MDRWVTSAATEFEEVVNPATEEALVNVPLSSEAETAEAIRVADEAFSNMEKSKCSSSWPLSFQIASFIDDE